jgi:transposase
MARRHELTDAQWDLIKGFFPGQGRGGKWADHRRAFNGILWRLRTGAPWRDLPARYGPWQTVYHRFNAMRRAGLLDRILERLQARLNAEGLIDPELFCVDGTNVRASRSAAGASKKLGSRRAGRPRAGSLARRVRLEGPPGLRRPRRAACGGRHGGPAAGVHAVRAADGPGPPPRRRARPSAMPAGEAGRRQRL